MSAASPDIGRECGKASENAPVNHRRHCRLSVSGDELQIAGPPAALRTLSGLLRRHTEPVEVTITGGTVAQEVTAGPLLISRRDRTTLSVSAGRDYLDIFWDALDGVADQAETAEERGVNRHQHIEYRPGDDYRSPDSLPLVIVADWPDDPPRTTT
jgi:hypothetical protein